MNEELCLKEEVEALLVLIRKEVNPSSIRSFRPISLCNVAFKLLKKLIMKRLRGILGELIASDQVNFVPNMQGINNVIV